METSTLRKSMPVSALFDPKIVVPAIGSAFVKLNPRTLMKNPVMFVLEIVTVLTTVILIRDLVTGGGHICFEFQIVLWLWFTVLFANFAEAIAEGRGKAQADTLRRQRTETQAKLIDRRGPAEFQARRLRPSSRSAMSCWSKPATRSRPTAKSSKAWPRSTRRRSPANPRRSSANPAATARR